MSFSLGNPIRIGVYNDTLIWTESPKIHRANMDGTSITTIPGLDAYNSPFGLDIDRQGYVKTFYMSYHVSVGILNHNVTATE